MKLRVKFIKFGPVRFIGHLDVMRFFQKTIRRAGIDVCYTAGFSPHQVMSFAQPLGVGLESNGEYMDIEVNSIVSCRDVIDRLNAASVPGIQVTSVKILPETAGNAMASVAAAKYSVFFVKDREPGFDISQAIKNLLVSKEIIITKETKTGLHEVDLKPGIYELDWDSQRECINMFVDASSSGNIKPIQIVEKLFKENNEILKENALFVIREDTYTSKEENGKRIFISLDDVGYIE